MNFPISALTSATAPTSTSTTWSFPFAEQNSVKAVVPMVDLGVGVLLWTDGPAAGSAAVAILDASGRRPAPPTAARPRRARSRAASVIARRLPWVGRDVHQLRRAARRGHGHGGLRRRLRIPHRRARHVRVRERALWQADEGARPHRRDDIASASLALRRDRRSVAQVATADGKFVWTKFFSSCGTPNACGLTVILNECWGVQARRVADKRARAQHERSRGRGRRRRCPTAARSSDAARGSRTARGTRIVI